MDNGCIFNYIEKQAQTWPDRPVLLAPKRQALTYNELYIFVKETSQFLLENGFRNKDRIAVVLSNGPEMACAFFSISNIATFVPLNPDYSEEEFRYYLSLLQIKVLLVEEDKTYPAQNAAKELKVPIIYMKPKISSHAGLFDLSIPEHPNENSDTLVYQPQNSDIAVILYTSGTTSQPKIVTLSHAGMCMNAETRARAFHLTEEDRHLLVIPMFRGNALNTLVTSITVGASVICAGNFETGKFHDLLQEMSPTWYAAGPGVHQTIVDHFLKGGSRPKVRLRFIRSTGAPLPAKLAEHLESFFHAPVVITYGLTETGTVACNYLAPKGHKEGSVGVTVGKEIGIMNVNGELLPVGARGEIVVRGSGVFNGYEGEDAQQVFAEGWFKTGDQGYLDEDSYLFITGRIKELINRGGEKVSPYEVEKVIIEHPDIAEAVVFGIPRSQSDETVAAMVVPEAGAALSINQLRHFLRGKITYFKMPQKLYCVDKIPVGPNGKVQRNTLYQQLGALKIGNQKIQSSDRDLAKPRNEIEQKLALIWQDILEVKCVGIYDDFFDLGGDSLAVARLFGEIEHVWSLKISVAAFYQQATIAELAKMINRGDANTLNSPFVVPIQTEGSRLPIFCFLGLRTDIMAYRTLAFHLGKDQPVYGLCFKLNGYDSDQQVNLQKVAARYIQDIKGIQPIGPYLLVGYCLGGKIAYEVATQLKSSGNEIYLLALLDSRVFAKAGWREKLCRLRKVLPRQTITQFIPWVMTKLKNKRGKLLLNMQQFILYKTPQTCRSKVEKYVNEKAVYKAIVNRGTPSFYRGEAVFVVPEEDKDLAAPTLEKLAEIAGSVYVIEVLGNHTSMMKEPHVVRIAHELKRYIAEKRSVSN